MKIHRPLLLSAVALGLFVPPSGRAVLNVYEGFDYVGGSSIGGKGGGTGFGGNAWVDLEESVSGEEDTVASGSLAYTSLTTSGNALESTSLELGSNLTLRFANIAGVNGTRTWISFLARVSVPGGSLRVNEPVASEPGRVISDTFLVKVGTNGRTLSMGIQQDASDQLFFALQTGTDTNTFTTIAPMANMTYLVVASILWNTAADGLETADIYINPTFGAPPPGSDATATLDLGTAGTGSNNRLRDLGISTTSNAVWTFDEIRMGDSFGAVTPVPEPATGLLALAGLWLLVPRRRRRFPL